MSYGPVQKFPVSIASGATSSGGVDLGKSFSEVYLDIPSACTFNFNIQGSADGSSFKRIYNAPSDNDSVVTAVEITSATAGTDGAIVKLPCVVRYMKVESQTAVTNGLSLNFIAVD
jgi:hypothetical protein